MDIKEMLNFIEDKNFDINENWYFHATAENIEIIKQIFIEGIKIGIFIRRRK